MRLPFVVTALLLACLACAPGCASADCSVRGSVYDWATFSTVNNAIVDVYSVPGMSLLNHVVVKTGGYSFSLPRGDYMIVATAGTPGTLTEITATENISVPDSGERIIDLILFPPSSLDDLSDFTDNNATPTLPPDEGPTAPPGPTGQLPGGLSALCLGGGAIALALAAIIAGVFMLRTLRPRHPAETPPASTVSKPAETSRPASAPPPAPDDAAGAPPPASQPAPRASPQPVPQAPPPVHEQLLPEDCRQVLAIIEKNDGRITQLDLRKMLPYSEAKVSLIVSDLESRGLVKKIKKGRGNVLILNRPGGRPPEP